MAAFEKRISDDRANRPIRYTPGQTTAVIQVALTHGPQVSPSHMAEPSGHGQQTFGLELPVSPQYPTPDSTSVISFLLSQCTQGSIPPTGYHPLPISLSLKPMSRGHLPLSWPLLSSSSHTEGSNHTVFAVQKFVPS